MHTHLDALAPTSIIAFKYGYLAIEELIALYYKEINWKHTVNIFLVFLSFF